MLTILHPQYKTVAIQVNLMILYFVNPNTYILCSYGPIVSKSVLYCKQDNKGNRINQWINAKAINGMILQLSHVLNPEASVGFYEVSVETNKATFKEQFQVKKYGK